MIFCRKCGRYYSDGSSQCTACGADLKTAGQSTFQGGAVQVGAISYAPARAAAAAAVAMAPARTAVAVADAEETPDGVNPVFNRDKFLLRQKAMAIKEKYYVTDETGGPLCFVERPALLTQQLIMLAAVAAVFFGGTTLVSFVVGLVAAGNGLVSTLGVAIVFGLTLLTFVLLIPKRHITFYKDDSKMDKLMEIKQLNKVEFPFANFTILDAEGNPIGKLRKNVLFDYIRRRWYILSNSGLQLFIAKEDSIILSLLRRTGIPIFLFLRTNFIFLRGDAVIGEFNRKLTLLDRYVLDMSADSQRSIDRRIALALGVMLDTGERR